MMKRPGLLLAVVLSASAGSAWAGDYIVVASSDPAIARGSEYDGGTRIPLAPGQTVTLMHASGDTLRLKGLAGGVTLPRRMASASEAERLAVLRLIVAPPKPRPASALYAAQTRGGLCPDVASVTTLDAIVQVQGGGCPSEAAQALAAWLEAHPPSDG